jgi:hypothetical protein
MTKTPEEINKYWEFIDEHPLTKSESQSMVMVGSFGICFWPALVELVRSHRELSRGEGRTIRGTIATHSHHILWFYEKSSCNKPTHYVKLHTNLTGHTQCPEVSRLGEAILYPTFLLDVSFNSTKTRSAY